MTEGGRRVGFHRPPVDEAAVPPAEDDRSGRAGSDRVEPAPEDAPVVPIIDLVIAGVAALLLIANGPRLARGSPVLLAALAWPLGAAGLVALAVLAWRRTTAAWWAGAYLAWALVAVAASAQPRLSWNAGYGADRGWVYLATYLGCWALARRRGAALRTLLTGALLFGLVLNGLLGILQVAVGDGTGLLAAPDGRAAGFPLNAVFLGGLMSGAVALAAAHAGRAEGRRWLAWCVGVAAAMFVVNLSGSRVALAGGALLAVAAVAVATRTDRTTALVRTAAVVGAVVLGSLLAVPFQATGSGTSRVSETTGESGGLSSRVTMWKAGLHAVGERPVTGWGPNRFRPATNARVTPEFVAAEGPERLYFDAHDLLVEHLVTVGIPGLVLLVGFGVAAARQARGPLAWYAAGVAITWLLEPAAISTVPTALLALGAAAAGTAPDPPLARPVARTASRVATVVAVTVALLAGGRLIAVDHLLLKAPDGAPRLDQARRALDLLPRDVAVADAYTQAVSAEAARTPTGANRAAAVRAAEAATRLDPTWSHLWSNLGLVEEEAAVGARTDRLRAAKAELRRQHPDWFDLRLNLALAWDQAQRPPAERFDRARAAFARAQAISPWSVIALTNLYLIDLEAGHQQQAAAWRAKVCRTGPANCPPPQP